MWPGWPAQAILASLGRGNTTAALRTAAVAAGSSWPFATAARLLGELLGAEISPEQVRRLTLAAGRQVAHDQQVAAAAIVTPSADTVRAERTAATERTRHGSRPVPQPPVPTRLLVGVWLLGALTLATAGWLLRQRARPLLSFGVLALAALAAVTGSALLLGGGNLG